MKAVWRWDGVKKSLEIFFTPFSHLDEGEKGLESETAQKQLSF